MKGHLKYILVLLPFVLLPSCHMGNSNSITFSSDEDSVSESPITFYLEELDDEFDIHTRAQNAFILERFDASREFQIDGNHELSKPTSLILEWDASADNGIQINEFILSISENEDMNNSVNYHTGYNTSQEITNLKIHQDYYWNVTAICGTTSYTSKTSHFKTVDDGPRNLNIDGITNVRDCGGWPIGDPSEGKYVKQGLLYRTARLNRSAVIDPIIEITDSGRNVMINDLKVKTEIDLRLDYDYDNGGITTSPLGDTISYLPCPMEYNVSNIMVDNKEEVKHVFEILSNETNYPLFFHCNIGTDRTGMISFLVLGLLGVREQYLKLDYEFSSLGTIGSIREYSKLGSNYVGTIKKVYGESLSEKIRIYLNSIGVSDAQLDSIIRILG